MKEVRVAIIGTGAISNRHMMVYSNIQQNAARLGFTAKVVACAEIDDAKRKAWAEKYHIDEKDCYRDFREMLKRDDIDTVDVCTHNNLHAPISIAVMKAGYDCYCEKPEAASYEDARLMIEASKKLGRKFHVQVSSLMTAQTRVARDMIKEGKLGNVYFANLAQCQMRRRPGYDMSSRGATTDFYSKVMAGHGPAVDGGVYFISQILFMLGMPELESVYGFAAKGCDIEEKMLRDHPFGVEDIISGIAKFKGGIGFNVTMTSANNYKDYDMTYILGSKGGLEITGTDAVGGKWARPGMRGKSWAGDPELRYFGKLDGRDVSIDLRCDANSEEEEIINPEIVYYNDNQIMWLAYKLGILTDETRYNTPEIAAQQLLLTDGIFLSEALGRSITADEIKGMSKSICVKEQMIGSELVKYDLEV